MKKLFSLLLVLCLLVGLCVLPAEKAAADETYGYFYDQLPEKAKRIYEALSAVDMTTGTADYDLAENGVVTQSELRDYINGTGDLVDHFSAAKDAFDLDHPEIWYMDSSYLCLRVSRRADGSYAAILGPGRAETYYVQGLTGPDEVKAKDQALKGILREIKSGAESQSGTAAKVKYVHDQITARISYRYEDRCAPENAPYVRTLYALVTHEGVCEAYARSLQYILKDLGIPCVPVHGLQTSGDQPEEHMWTAVQIDGSWYVVDPTWDDPIALDASGAVKPSDNGVDGGENHTYLLVGTDVTGKNWQASGIVSDGNFEFAYPAIAQRSFDWNEELSNMSGLRVTVEEGFMEGVRQGKFRTSYLGLNCADAAERGYHLLVRMYDLDENGAFTNKRGDILSKDDWYYVESGLAATQMDPAAEIFNDNSDHVVMMLDEAYIEFAVTTRAPASYNGGDATEDYFFYTGNGGDILAETGPVFNPYRSDYTAPPYIARQYPDTTVQLTIGETYRVHLEYDQLLYHPAADWLEKTDEELIDELHFADGDTAAYLADFKAAASAQAGMAESTFNYTLQGGTQLQPRTLSGTHTFGNIQWLYECDLAGEAGHVCMPDTCPIRGVEFDYAASTMWADDSVLYKYVPVGLVGVNSHKVPNAVGYVASNPTCPVCYRATGIRWSLWGQPSLLDNVDDLDLEKLAVEDGTGNRTSFAQLEGALNTDGYNGRLALVVEDLSLSRPRTEEVTGALEAFEGIRESDIAQGGRALYEIGFTRLCSQTVINDGEKLRLQVGFPGDYTAESNVVFKAYHFTRDDTGNIVSAEEIPLAVTAYGLVVTVESFSPFEIVALKPESVPGAASSQHTVITVTDGNGTLTCSGKTAAGENGVIPFDKGQSRTFIVTPRAGYVLDTLTLDGEPVAVDAGGAFVLTYEDTAAVSKILAAAFVPQSVQDAETARELTPVVPVLTPLPFTDVSAAQWFFEAVRFAYTQGIMNGMGNGKFAPSADTSRAQIAAVLYNMEKDPVPAPDPGFTDLTKGWYKEAVAWAKANEVVSGVSATAFAPDSPVTREQLATMLYNYTRAKEYDAVVSGSLNAFDDRDKVSSWAVEAMLWATGHGIINGNTDGTLNPKGKATRAQVAAVFKNYYENILDR